MDKKLLDALNNLSESLDLIAQVLSEKNSAESPTAKSLEEGDFVNQIKEINEGIKKIQADNQKIIKNQETILALSKKNENDKKTDAFQKAGDKNMQKLIKTGVSIVLIIAAGVLAIGMAFKLIGKVDFLSVVSLSLAIVLISIAFEKIAKLKMSVKEAAITSLTMIIMAGSITASSWILSLVKPISFAQALTAIGIAGMFTFIAPAIATLIKSMESEDEFEYNGMKFKSRSLKFSQVLAASAMLPLLMSGMSLGILASSYILSKVRPISIPQALTAIGIGFVFALIAPAISSLISGIMYEQSGSAFGMRFKSKGISWKTAIVAALALPIVMTGIALAITSSSYILSKVKPITLMQGLTAILISGIFTVLAFGIKNIITTFGGENALAGALVAAVVLPILFIAMSWAMMQSSYNFAKIQPIKFNQFLTALGISIIFVALSFAMSMIFKSLGDISPAKALTASIILPILFVGMSIAIMYSSEFLSKTTPVDYGLLFNIVVMSIALSISTIAVAATIWVMDKMGFIKNPVNFLVGSALVILTAGVIMASSWLLNKGTYDNTPSLDWGLGVILSIGAFAVLAGVIGSIAISGVGFVAMLLGLGTMVMIAATIMEISKILSKGDFSYGKELFPWAKSVSLLYMTFARIMVSLGTMGIVGSITSLFGGSDPFKSAKDMMVQIAKTIKSVSTTLADGNYKGGPKIEWAYGVSRAIAAFSYVYFKLQKSQGLISILKGDNAAEGFTKAIKIISEGIVQAAKLFAESGITVWQAAPPEEWARGVGLAIRSFAPVYKIFTDQSLIDSLLNTDSKQEQIKKAMITISEGIVDVAKLFNENKVPFTGNYPTKNWGEGVSAGMKGFGEIYNLLYDYGWDISDLEEWRPSISHIIDDMGMAARKFTRFKKTGLSWIFPDPKGTKSLEENIIKMVDIYQHLYKNMWNENKVKKYGKSVKNLITNMISLAKILNKNNNIWKSKIDPDFMEKLKSNVISYVELAKFINYNLSSGKVGLTGAISNVLFGKESTKNPINRVIDGMIRLGSAYNILSKSINNFGNAIDRIDVEKLSTIKSFTSNVILMSLMDPKEFEEMLDKLEKKAGVFTDIINDINSNENSSRKSVTNVKQSKFVSNQQDESNKKMLQILSSIDFKLATISRNSSTLADYANELRTSQSVKIKK
jgi:hypothetical protein